MKLINQISFVDFNPDWKNNCQYTIVRGKKFSVGIVFHDDIILRTLIGITISDTRQQIKAEFPNATQLKTSVPHQLNQQADQRPTTSSKHPSQLPTSVPYQLDQQADQSPTSSSKHPSQLPTSVPYQLDLQLADYLSGKPTAFKCKLAIYATGFAAKAIKACSKIPYGSTLSYAQLAAKAGNTKAARAAGSAMKNNRSVLIVPCHRIIKSDATPGHFSAPRGTETKITLLNMEAKSTYIISRKLIL